MAGTATKPAGQSGVMITVATLTVLAVIGGGLGGKIVAGRAQATAPGVVAPASIADKPAPYGGDVDVRELSAVITNLAQPEEARVRLQVAMVYAKAGVENPNLLAAKISDDIVAFLKTLTVSELEGPSGLQALREDLNERATIRSDGKVREIIIEALVVQ